MGKMTNDCPLWGTSGLHFSCCALQTRHAGASRTHDTTDAEGRAGATSTRTIVTYVWQVSLYSVYDGPKIVIQTI